MIIAHTPVTLYQLRGEINTWGKTDESKREKERTDREHTWRWRWNSATIYPSHVLVQWDARVLRTYQCPLWIQIHKSVWKSQKLRSFRDKTCFVVFFSIKMMQWWLSEHPALCKQEPLTANLTHLMVSVIQSVRASEHVTWRRNEALLP